MRGAAWEAAAAPSNKAKGEGKRSLIEEALRQKKDKEGGKQPSGEAQEDN